MWAGTLAMNSALFSWRAMFSASLRSFCGALALQGSKIRSSVSDCPLAGHRCFAIMKIFSGLPLFEVGNPATRMVFLFRSTLVHCCTGSVLSPDASTVAMLGRNERCEYIGDAVVAGSGCCA